MGDEKLLNPQIIELEGKAQVGLVEQVELVECEKPSGWKKLRAILVDGTIEETNCMEPDAARRNYMVFVLYSKRWGKMINIGEQ